MAIQSLERSGIAAFNKYSSMLAGYELFTPVTNVEYLVIAGGGGGGSSTGVQYSSGGGAGGYRSSATGETSGGGAAAESKLSLLTNTVYSVTIGAGGAATAQGSDSTLIGITSLGGGRGRGDSFGPGYSGGSGSGGTKVSNVGGAGTAGQGYAGGWGSSSGSYSDSAAGGGGGAGGIGMAYASDWFTNSPLAGGDGKQSAITGTLTWYAAGGCGAGYYSGGRTNGIGGGTPDQKDGTVNTGSGGGGGRFDTGGAGGSGVVIIKYPKTFGVVPSAGLTAETIPNGEFNVTRFTAGTGTFTFKKLISFPVTYMVVAGGAAAGGRHSGGGGAGQVTYNTAYTMSTSIFNVTVGAGGAAVYGEAGGANGSDSVFLEVAKGGGGSGSYPSTNGIAGGSGGGGAHDNKPGGASIKTSSVLGATTYGTAGAQTTWGGGGGGATQAGVGYKGGDGFQTSITGTSYWFGGGGGGSVWDSGTAGNGGKGGGGGGGSAGTNQSAGLGDTNGINPAENGQNTNSYYGPGPSKGGNGGVNTGGGGGGSGQSVHASFTNPVINKGGNGGSGIVVIRYPLARTLTLGTGLTGSTSTVGTEKVTIITAGTGTVSFT